MRSPLVLSLLMAVVIVGCGGEDGDGVDLEGWEAQGEISGVPIYTSITQDEACLLESVSGSFLHAYNKTTSRYVRGFWVIRDPEQTIPCIDGPHGTACRWIEVNGAFGWEDQGEPGPGGLFVGGGLVFVSVYGAHGYLFTLHTMHEFGHALLGLHHETQEQREGWCEWEDSFWWDWVHPAVLDSCPTATGMTAWTMCPWRNPE